MFWRDHSLIGQPQTLGNALVLVALALGVFLGQSVGGLVFALMSAPPQDFKPRLKVSLGAFGGLSLPPAVASWKNENLGTEINLMSAEMHILWPCVVAIFFFFVAPDKNSKP